MKKTGKSPRRWKVAAGEEEARTIDSGNTTEADDTRYDRMPQSFPTETDLDVDSIIATNEGTPIIPAELEGLPVPTGTRGAEKDAGGC